MAESLDQLNSARPPRGIFPSRCDDKGRVRIPKEIEDFLKTLPTTQFFVTTLDCNIAKVYPMPVWEANEKLLREDTENTDECEHLLFRADFYGGTSGIDGQGRVSVSQELRHLLGIEDQKVYLRCSESVIELFSDAGSKHRLALADQAAPAVLPVLKKKGLK